MKRPVLVNIELTDEKDNVNIAAALIDFHPSQIHRMTRTYDDMTALVDIYNVEVKILLPFDAAVKIYDSQQRIDKTYKEDVDEYYDDNYKSYKDLLNGKSD